MNEIFLVGGMALVTFLIRYPMLAMIGKVQMPTRIMGALNYVAPAVLAAIILPETLMPGGSQLELNFSNTRLIAGIVTAGIMVISKNLLVTIIGGMAVFLALNFLARGGI